MYNIYIAKINFICHDSEKESEIFCLTIFFCLNDAIFLYFL